MNISACLRPILQAFAGYFSIRLVNKTGIAKFHPLDGDARMFPRSLAMSVMQWHLQRWISPLWVSGRMATLPSTIRRQTSKRRSHI